MSAPLAPSHRFLTSPYILILCWPFLYMPSCVIIPHATMNSSHRVRMRHP